MTFWVLIANGVIMRRLRLPGGVAMLMDPGGGSLAMADLLLLPLSDFVLPGLFLLVVMGLTPIFLSYALLDRPDWDWLGRLSRGMGYYWAWTGTLALTVVLAVWLAVQAVLIGFRWPIQNATAANGLAIFLPALVPGVRRFYA